MRAETGRYPGAGLVGVDAGWGAVVGYRGGGEREILEVAICSESHEVMNSME